MVDRGGAGGSVLLNLAIALVVDLETSLSLHSKPSAALLPHVSPPTPQYRAYSEPG